MLQSGVFFHVFPCRVYEQPLLLQPDPNTLILEGHIHANPKPKVCQITLFNLEPALKRCSGDLALQWGLCEGVREEGDQAVTITLTNTNMITNTNKNANAKVAKLEPMEGANKWKASLTITVRLSWVFELAPIGQKDGYVHFYLSSPFLVFPEAKSNVTKLS